MLQTMRRKGGNHLLDEIDEETKLRGLSKKPVHDDDIFVCLRDTSIERHEQKQREERPQ